MLYYHERVGLRSVEEEDLPLLARCRNDPRTRQMFFTPGLISLSGQRKWYEKLLNDPTRVQFMIVQLEDDATIGTIGLANIDYRNQCAELGVFFVDPSVRRQKLGIEAVHALLRHAFNDLNLNRVYAKVFAFNKPILEGSLQAGFRSEGVARQAAFANGEFHDVVHIGVLREEWRALAMGEAQDDRANPIPG